MPGPLQLSARSNLISLINMFVLCKTSSLTTPPPPPLPPRPAPGSFSAGEERKGSEDIPMLGAIEEMQLLLTLHNQLEEQKNLELRYCVFEAIFSAEAEVRANVQAFLNINGGGGIISMVKSLYSPIHNRSTAKYSVLIQRSFHPFSRPPQASVAFSRSSSR